MAHPLFSTSLTLFLLMDPIGNIPAYVSILRSIESRRSLWIIFRENCIALLIVVAFAIFGNRLLSFLSVSNESVYLAGGIVLFMISIKMIFPTKNNLADSLLGDEEPFIFPLAVPLIAGPSLLAAIVIYSKQLPSKVILFSSIGIAWVISTLILMTSAYLKEWLGSRGISALERLMGLILMLIAINMFLQGVELYRAMH